MEKATKKPMRKGGKLLDRNTNYYMQMLSVTLPFEKMVKTAAMGWQKHIGEREINWQLSTV